MDAQSHFAAGEKGMEAGESEKRNIANAAEVHP
jgi:hypothetical protein